jgi:hypothetical protein
MLGKSVCDHRQLPFCESGHQDMPQGEAAVSMDSGNDSACAAPSKAAGTGLSISHTGMDCR